MFPNWSTIHTVMVGLAALAAGLPSFGAALPPSFEPWIKGITAALVLIVAVLGAITPSAGDGKSKSAAGNQAGFVQIRALAFVVAMGLIALAFVNPAPRAASSSADTAGCGLFGQVEPPAADCGKAILDDAAKGYTVQQIVSDLLPRCTLDAAAVITALLAAEKEHPGSVSSTKAYAEARRAQVHEEQACPPSGR